MTAKKEEGQTVHTHSPARGRKHLGYHTPGPVPYRARVCLREACEARGLSLYAVAMSGYAQGTIDRDTVYRLARGDTRRVDLGTLEVLAGILHALTGEVCGVSDLLALEVDSTRAQVERWEAGTGL